jgi:hypothetical protein
VAKKASFAVKAAAEKGQSGNLMGTLQTLKVKHYCFRSSFGCGFCFVLANRSNTWTALGVLIGHKTHF